MSSIIVDVVEIESVRPHDNADRLFLTDIRGWQTVITKLDDGSPQFPSGTKVVYIPPDSTVPRELAEQLGVIDYLSERTNIDGGTDLVVKRVRLRGEPSYGFVITPDDPDWPVGTDVREHYGIGKYRPPVQFDAEDAEASHPLFHTYTDIENLRDFPEVFIDGEDVVITEKIHGTNARIGIVEGSLLAGSHRIQRMRPAPDEMTANTYWFPATQEPVIDLLESLRDQHRVAILYGEVYGAHIQKLHYGQHSGLAFAAFDIYVDDRYLDFDEFHALCQHHGVNTVPTVDRVPYSLKRVGETSRGKTMLQDDHIREGVVIRPTTERLDPRIGRVILKYLSDDYLLNSKLAAADTTDM